MSRYILSHGAELDLFDVLNFRERRSEKAALALERQFIDAFIYLSEWPGSGHVREEVSGAYLRFWRVDDYLITYNPDSIPLQIHAIIHGSRDMSAAFRSRLPDL